MPCFWLLCSLFKSVGSKSSPFDSAWTMGGSRPQVNESKHIIYNLQYLILVQLHSRKGHNRFQPQFTKPPFCLLTWSWPTLHLMAAWAHIGFLVCKLCFRIVAMTVTTWLFFLPFVEGKQKLGCFSCEVTYDVTCNERTQREATFQLIQSQNPSSLIQSMFGRHHAVSGSYPAIQHGRGACLATRDLDRKLD